MGKTRINSSHASNKAQAVTSHDVSAQQSIEQEQITNQIDGHDVQQASNSISTYTLMPTAEIDEVELQQRVTRAAAINENPNFLSEIWQEACDTVGSSIPAEAGPIFIKEIVQQIINCGVFICTMGKKPCVFPIEILWAEKQNSKYIEAIQAIRKSIQNTSFTIKKDNLKNLVQKGFLREGDSAQTESYDFTNQTVIQKQESFISAFNWFDTNFVFNIQNIIQVIVNTIKVFEILKINNEAENEIERLSSEIQFITPESTDKAINEIPWDNILSM